MINDLLNILANDERRHLLFVLLENDCQEGTTKIPDDVTITGAGYETQLVELRHCQLPMLAQSELIEWDRERNTVARGVRFDDAKPLLELLASHSDKLPDRWRTTPVSAE